jgi:hypothetical protein
MRPSKNYALSLVPAGLRIMYFLDLVGKKIVLMTMNYNSKILQTRIYFEANHTCLRIQF